MALPENLAYTLITGRFLRASADSGDADAYPDGVPISNLSITFTPDITPARVKSATSVPPVMLTLGVLGAVTDEDGDVASAVTGNKGLYILSSNDPDLDPNGWTYTVKITGTGFPEIKFAFVARAGETMDLTTMVPVPVNPGAAIAAWELVSAAAISAKNAAEAAAAEAEQSALDAAAAAASVEDASDAAVQAAASAAAAAQSAADAEAAEAGVAASAATATNAAASAATSASTASTAATNAAASETAAETAQAAAEAAQAAATAIVNGAKVRVIYPYGETGTLEVGVGTSRLYNDTGVALTIVSVRASVGTAPVGADLLIDVNRNVDSIFTTQANRPRIVDGTITDTAVPDVTVWGVGDYLTIDVDQVGSTTPGEDLTVSIVTEGDVIV